MLFGAYKLFGKHFIANIAVESKKASGIEVQSERDPRKWRLPPDSFSATIEEVGSGCTMVKPGDQASIERWQYLQLDLDDERIVAEEKHVLAVNGRPVNGVVVMSLSEEVQRERGGVILPEDGVLKAMKRSSYYEGIVTATSLDFPPKGATLWVKKSERDQWKSGDGKKLIFRWDEPDKDPFSNIMAWAPSR